MLKDDVHSLRRHSLRLRDFDYRQPGSYFVTVCAHRRQCLFGEVVDGCVFPTEAGEIALACWRAIPDHFSGIELGEHVLMPNHLHGLLHIAGPVGARHASPLRQRVALGVVIAGFKSAASKEIRRLPGMASQMIWQRGYHEHVVRNETSLRAIREYIVSNPLQWHLDRENPHCGSV